MPLHSMDGWMSNKQLQFFTTHVLIAADTRCSDSNSSDSNRVHVPQPYALPKLHNFQQWAVLSFHN